MTRIIVPLFFAVSICSYAFWRFLKRVETPVSNVMQDVQKILSSSQLLLDNLNDVVLKASDTVTKVDHAIENVDHTVDEMRIPLEQTLAIAEDTMHNIDSTVSMVQLKPFTNGIKKSGNAFIRILCCKYKEKDPLC